MKLKLFAREDGRYGVRNRIAVIPTVACVNHLAEQIAAGVEIADAYTHPYGCDQLGFDRELSFHCLERMGSHPNVGAVLVVGLGCEEIDAEELEQAIRQHRTRTASMIMQQTGGTTFCVEKGIEICKQFAAQLAKDERVETEISHLTIGVECGGSDFSSGIASNPAVGVFTEKLCAAGGKVVFGETTELMGAENLLRPLCQRQETYEFIVQSIQKMEQTALDLKVDLRGTQPSPGNIAGGLGTIEEKSLGGICKIGSAPIVDAVPFGGAATKAGVTFVDTPGNDLACSLGLSAAGAQIILFTTGRGTPMGFAAAPVLKLTANGTIYERMKENFDLDLSGILTGDLSVDQAGQQIFEMVCKTAEGAESAAETLGHREFSLYRISPVLT